ncbi:MAG: insulinase family protein, partial [bacterium]
MIAMKKTSQTASPQETLFIKPLEVRNIELPNGLRLLAQPDHSTPVVSIQAWCRTGSMTEGQYEGCGISHFLEHMLFKGTEKRANSEIAHTIQGLGGYLNAYTFFDRTVFYFELPSAGWKTALDVLADAVFHSTLPQEEFEKEREVIRREFAMGFDDPERELQKLLFRTAFTTHPCRHPIIGHLDLFNQISPQELMQYYQSRYTTDNVTFIITGDVDPDEVARELTAITAPIQRRPTPPVYVPSEPVQLNRREAHNTFLTDVTRLCVAWHTPPVTHPDIYALDILAAVAGQGQSSRLQQELVEKRKLLRSVHAFSFSLAQSGLWAVSATLQPGQSREEAQKAILDSLRRLDASPTELAKVKRQAIAARANELKTVTGRAGSLGEGWFAARDIHFGENYLNALQKVTLADLKRVANLYLTENNLTIVSLNPQKEATAATPRPATQTALAVECRALANGAKVVLTPDAKVPLVTIGVTGRGGLLAETAANNGISKLTSRLLDKGTPTRTAQQIAEEIENLGGNFEEDCGNNSFSLTIEVLQNDAEKAVELL